MSFAERMQPHLEDALTPEQQAECYAAIQAGKAARDRMIRSLMPLALAATEHIDPHLRDEAISAAMLGITEGTDKFDPSKGRLTTIAQYHVWRRVAEVKQAAGAKLIRVPRGEAFCEAAERARELAQAVGYMQTEALDRSAESPIDGASRIEAVVAVRRAVCRMKDSRLALLVSLRLAGLTLAEIGDAMRISKQRIHQYEKKAFRLLGVALKNKAD